MLPYVQGVSERIGRILKQQQVGVSYKPQVTINSLFPRPKEQDDSDRQKSGIVYKISCTHNMDFENVRVVGLEGNYHERLFLEAWYSPVIQMLGTMTSNPGSI